MNRIRLGILPTPVLLSSAAVCLLALGVYASRTTIAISDFPPTLEGGDRPFTEPTDRRACVFKPLDLDLAGTEDAQDETDSEPAAQPAEWQLVAVELSAAGSLAFLDLGDGTALRALRIADEIDGRRVVGIERQGVRWQNRHDHVEWLLPLQEESS